MSLWLLALCVLVNSLEHLFVLLVALASPAHLLVLDVPGAFELLLLIDLFRLDGGADDKPVLIKTTETNNDGRCDAPLLDGEALQKGRYQLLFRVAAYLRRAGDDLPEIPFLDDVVINFGIDNPTQHYHVPLLLSAYGYSTYRGS